MKINLKSPLLNQTEVAKLTGMPGSTYFNRLHGRGGNKRLTAVDVDRISYAIIESLAVKEPEFEITNNLLINQLKELSK